MVTLQHIQVAGQRFVLIEESEYERLRTRAGERATLSDDNMPSLPDADAEGRFPALEYARISLARDIVRDRRAAGLTQQELAKRARTRQETISRIETGKFTPSVKLVDRIDQVLEKALSARRQRASKQNLKKGRTS